MASSATWTVNVVEKNLVSDLKCPICFEFYTSPLMLPCTHVMCRSCIVKLLISGYMNCPICQADLKVPDGLDSLVKLHLLARMAEVYTSQDSSLTDIAKLRLIGNYLKCPQCKMFYTLPMLLPCTHVLCGRCSSKILKRKRLTCPICETVSDVPPGTCALVNIPPIERITEIYKGDNTLSDKNMGDNTLPDKNMKSGAGVCRSLGKMIACVILGLPTPFVMLQIGYLFMDKCPIEIFIPIYLLVMGLVSSWLAFVVIFWLATANENYRIIATVFMNVTVTFMSGWFIAGCIWIFSVRSTVNLNDSNSDKYCHATLYQFAFWLTTLTFFSVFVGIIGFGIFLVIKK